MPLKIRTKYNGQGVYAIICLRKMRCYIGSSDNVYNRAKQHKSLLKSGKHYAIELQKDYNNGFELDFILLEKTNFYDYRKLHLHEYTCMYQALCDDFKLYNKQCVQGENFIEKRNYLANTITHFFKVLYCENVHNIIDKKFHGLTGYKISYSVMRNKNIPDETPTDDLKNRS